MNVVSVFDPRISWQGERGLDVGDLGMIRGRHVRQSRYKERIMSVSRGLISGVMVGAIKGWSMKMLKAGTIQYNYMVCKIWRFPML